MSQGEYKAPTPEAITEFCETLREQMIEAARHTTLTIEASFGEHEVMSHDPTPIYRQCEPDGSWTVTVRSGPIQ